MKISLAGEIQMLKAVPLFRSLKEDELRIVALTTENVIYEPGEWILREGDEGDEAFIIYSGTVKVYRKTAAGASALLNTLGPGGMFGELALFGTGLRTASVQAVEETLVSVIAKDKLYEIIRSFPDVAIVMLRVLTERFARAEDRLMKGAASDSDE